MARIALVLGVALAGGIAGAVAVLAFLGWGAPQLGQETVTTPQRSDYLDLMLFISSLLLGAVGVAVTVGALVIGVVAFKSFREIKDDSVAASEGAARQEVNSKLPQSLEAQLNESRIVLHSLRELAARGELDEVFNRVTMRISSGASEWEDEYEDEVNNE